MHDQLERFSLVPMRPRDAGQAHRTASPLELFFDLVFVIAVATAAVSLHHELAEAHVLSGVVSYLLVFFAIWWAWMNFTWFATSFDTDDWFYRVLTVLQMAGVLVFAAGIEGFFAKEPDFTVGVTGYVIMRVAMVAQWWRASLHSGPTAKTARTYALGIAAVQVLWVLWLLLVPNEAKLFLFFVLAAAELSVPIIAERQGRETPWHPHHITERYGLFTLIVLGESLLASANAIIEALHDAEHLAPLIVMAALTVTVTAALWWIYFWPPHHGAIGSLAESVRYGYAHFFVLAAAGAFSAGVEVQIDTLTGHGKLGELAAGLAVSIPVTIFILSIWWIAIRQFADRVVNVVVPTGALLALADPLVGVPMGLIAVVLVVVVVVLVRRSPQEVAH